MAFFDRRTRYEKPLQAFSKALKGPLIEDFSDQQVVFDKKEICKRIPNRGVFLFLDEVLKIEPSEKTAVGKFGLRTQSGVFEDHFPGSPIWPGVLHIDAIGQLGYLLFAECEKKTQTNKLTLCEVLNARYLRPIVPGSDVIIQSTYFESEYLLTVVGQCLQNSSVCSVTAINLLIGDEA
jgi:3-hydroxyacyl-[acyl-carrier-protein] dehydratase